MRPVFRPRRSCRTSVAIAAAIALSASSALAQGLVITGKIVSEQGLTLTGANVYITELNISQATNDSGVYRITLPPERVRSQAIMLRARAIGHTPQARQITLRPGEITENFALKQDVNRLSEVVITGVTGETEKKKLAFDIARVDQQDLAAVPAANPLSQIQGKIPGAHIVQSTGRPGQAPSTIIRGPKSINAENRSQGPLIVVDGVILEGGTQDLNPQDVESVEVVKGAAAASIYGSRAEAGVIQITTKSGKNAAQGTRFNFRTEYGLQNVQNEYPYARGHFVMMDENNERFCIAVTGLPACSRTVDFEEEAFRVNDQGGDFALQPYNFIRDYGIGLAPPLRDAKGLFQVNRWPRQYDPIGQAKTSNPISNTNLDMTGRFGNTGFFASANNYIEEGGIKFLEGYKRKSARLNMDQQIGESWTTSLQTFYSRATQFADGEWFRLTRIPAGVNMLRRDSKGRLFVRANPLNQGSQNENPLYDNDCCYDRSNADRYLGSLNTRYTPFSWLDLDAIASLDRRRTDRLEQQDVGFRTTAAGTANGGLVRGRSGETEAYNVALNATARHNFRNDLAARFNARYLYEQNDQTDILGEGNTLAVQSLLDLDNATAGLNINSGAEAQRTIGMLGGVNLEFKERYIADAIIRRDGSSLFGADQRWHNYFRSALAWVANEEPWFPFKDAFSLFKLRASVGTAGSRPSFEAQYETFQIQAGGLVQADARGNKDLKPQTTTETEFGVDLEVLSKYGLTVTYARDITKDQIVRVPPPTSSGFQTRWQNAGTLDGKTWEVSLNMPLISRRNLSWSARVNWDQNRTYITELGIPPQFNTIENARFRYAVGERMGNLYGKQFVTSCGMLDPTFRPNCGPGKAFQQNNEGYIVWVGDGNTWQEGITKNLWQAQLPGCVNAQGTKINANGAVECRNRGGVVNGPWGAGVTHWGMPIVLRDSTAVPIDAPLGNTLPDYRVSLSQNVVWKRLSFYGLVDAAVGSEVFNQELHWSLGDFMVKEEDQFGKTVGTAKPIGYYWRASATDAAAGVGGFYDIIGSNNRTVESGTYTKLRELSVAFQVGPVRGVGDWSVALVGRNLYTWDTYKGWDPEVGVAGGIANSGAISAVASHDYPQLRTFTLSLQTRF